MSEKFGKAADYSLGNFSGSQDRKFADFFAGTDSSCVLIEFKEFEREISDEHKKPLREKLCRTLDQNTAALSRTSHFIAYRSRNSAVNIELAPYVDVVCPHFSVGQPPLEAIVRNTHDAFIDAFLEGRSGTPFDAFLKYAGHMNSTAGGTADGANASFKSILYSRDKQGRVLGTLFHSLGELKQLLAKKAKLRSRLKP
ncbi:hypothetical protein [uncultured Pseudomonas sp.]|uniref:hypothetical protein n=1 Tax=uncultured Pseudomonas sp. TaxID=114707 RepID=UPI0025FA65E5|nr:hypothetical protein [uncultured Pseudomonas sp.]